MAYAGEAGTLLPGQAEVLTAGLAFGNYEQTSVHGYKFNDLNDNGVDNSEPRLAGWTIVLVGTNGQGNAVSDHARRRGPTASIRSPAWRRGRTR